MPNFGTIDRENVAGRLKEQENRTYLWLGLVFDLIKKTPSQFGKVSSIRSLLADLPPAVTDAYEKILDRSPDRETARILLQIIVAAKRSFTLDEANVALTIALHKPNSEQHKPFNFWPRARFKDFVTNLSGLFVTVHDSNLTLIHQTAREFLLDSTKLPGETPGKWQGSLNLAAAHGTIALVCLRYLNLQDFAKGQEIDKYSGQVSSQDLPQESHHGYTPRLKTFSPLPESKGEHALLLYAANNWVFHYESQTTKSQEATQTLASILCDPSSVQQEYWFSIYCAGALLFRDMTPNARFSFGGWTKLGIACVLGLRSLAENFIQEGEDVNSRAACFGTTLQAASANNHRDTVQLLLETGSDVNKPGGRYRTALLAASEKGYAGIVQILGYC